VDNSRSGGDPIPGPIEDLLAHLRALVEGRGTVEVSKTPGGWTQVSLTPKSGSAAHAGWLYRRTSELIAADGQVGEVILDVGRRGGRWELLPTVEDVEFMRRVLEAVIEGRVVETVSLARAQVVVTPGSGEPISTRVAAGCMGIVPLPGWRVWGKKIRYTAYT
jgi:hypothetical protein